MDLIPTEIWLYVADDGEVRFPEEENPSLYLIEPILSGGPVWDPTLPTLQEVAESVHLTVTERRYRLQRYVCGSAEAKAWILQDVNRARALVRACGTRGRDERTSGRA